MEAAPPHPSVTLHKMYPSVHPLSNHLVHYVSDLRISGVGPSQVTTIHPLTGNLNSLVQVVLPLFWPNIRSFSPNKISTKTNPKFSDWPIFQPRYPLGADVHDNISVERRSWQSQCRLWTESCGLEVICWPCSMLQGFPMVPLWWFTYGCINIYIYTYMIIIWLYIHIYTII